MANTGRERSLLELLLTEIDGDDRIDWSDVLDRVSSHPSEAAERIDDEVFPPLPLFLALDASDPPPPTEVVEALVDAHPAAARSRDRSGASPLFWAAAADGLGAEAMGPVLRADPSAASEPTAAGGAVPLHVASGRDKARALIGARPEAVSRRDGSGRLPLHLAAAYGSCGLVELLVEEGLARDGVRPGGCGGVLVPDDEGVTPLDIICDLIKSRTRFFVDGGERSVLYAPLDEAGSALMDKFEVCADAVLSHSIEFHVKQPFNAVHAAVALSCPPEVVWHAIATDPTRLKQQDGIGRLPLHVAAERADTPAEVISTLLDSHWGHQGTAAAKGGFGRLPLALLALNRQTYDGAFNRMVKAEPRALRVRDEEMGLYPFMLAAVGVESVLDVVYGLLLEDPSLIAAATKQPVM